MLSSFATARGDACSLLLPQTIRLVMTQLASGGLADAVRSNAFPPRAQSLGHAATGLRTTSRPRLRLCSVSEGSGARSTRANESLAFRSGQNPWSLG